MARPTKLTPERQEKIIQAILAGNYLETAAEYAGIGRETVYEWIARGEGRGKRGAKNNLMFTRFACAVREAIAQAEVRAVDIIQEGFANDPKLALDYLARRHPERWGKRDTVTVFRQLVLQVRGMSNDELLAALEADSESGDLENPIPGGGLPPLLSPPDEDSSAE